MRPPPLDLQGARFVLLIRPLGNFGLFQYILLPDHSWQVIKTIQEQT